MIRNVFGLFGTVAAGNMVARIAIALGASFVTFSGFDIVLTQATDSIKSLVSSVPAEVSALMGIASVDFAINLILSAYAGRLVLMSLRQIRFFK